MNGIDVHHHFFPPSYVARKSDAIIGATAELDPKRILGWRPELSIAEMDASGVISKAILSISTPGIWFGNKAETLALARESNEYGARLVADHPGRFGLFAVLPLPDVEGSLREIAYADEVLKVDGFGILTNYDGKWPGDPAFAPVFAELNRRKAIVHVHPTAPSCCALVPDVAAPVIEYPFDSTRAILSLLYSGTLAQQPDIRFIFSHGGGTLPMISARVIRSFSRQKFAKERAPLGAAYELRRLYYDTTGVASAPGMGALLKFVASSQTLFGSDTPYRSIAASLSEYAELDIPKADVEAIMGESARRLFSMRASDRQVQVSAARA